MLALLLFMELFERICCSILYTAISVPYNALVCNITSNPYEHGLLGVFAVLGGTIGGIAVQSTIISATNALGGDARAWQLVGIIYATCGLICHLVCFCFTKERCGTTSENKSNHQKISIKNELNALLKNPYWLLAIAICLFYTLVNGIMAASGMYYAKATLGDASYFTSIANATAFSQLIALFVSAIFMKHMGKRNMMLMGAVAMTVTSVVLGLFVGSATIVTVLCAIRGFSGGLLTAGLYGMVADTIDYSE